MKLWDFREYRESQIHRTLENVTVNPKQDESTSKIEK